MKYWPVHLLVFVLLVSIAYSEQFPVVCKDGYCVLKQSDIERIQQIVNDMVSSIEKLEGDNKRLRNTSGCS